MFTLAFFVSIEGRHDVFFTLAGDHGHFVDLWKAGLIALDAVAANAHGVDGLAGFGVAFELLGLSSHSDNSHKESKKSGEQLGHFASTIR